MNTKKVLYVHEDNVHNTRAASAFLPYLFEIVKPKSVLDVGCGTGTWLRVLKNNGIEEIKGIDGEYVDLSQLHISTDDFISADLRGPLNLKRKFDLVISLEVAEHLPESSADVFVKTLTDHSDVILFSSALTGQGGQNHVNEQSFSYWVKKFNSLGYTFIDAFREKIWDVSDIDWWYRQNMFLVIKNGHSLLETLIETKINDCYHPEAYGIVLKDLKVREQQVNDLDSIHEKFNLLMSGRYGFIQSLKVFIKSCINSFKV